jgi:inosine/xanthosine triphosphate pyrophosphatase family protein
MLARCAKLVRYLPVLILIFYRLPILVLAEPDETETSFTGNALLKARRAAMASGKPALADDSGLAGDGP